MGRIEEIKERLHKFQTAPRGQFQKGLALETYEALKNYSDNAPADIEYLLSRIQIAEEALEWYAKIPHYDRRLSGGTSAMEADAGGRARKALEQIHKE